MWSFAEARTTCRSAWSTLRIPAGHREAGTREWPPHWSRFWSGQTWPLQDLPTHSRHKQTWGLFTQERGHYICINSNAFFIDFFFSSPHIHRRKRSLSLILPCTENSIPAPLTEISQFEFSSLVDEEVLGFQVPVENFPLVTIWQAS